LIPRSTKDEPNDAEEAEEPDGTDDQNDGTVMKNLP